MDKRHFKEVFKEFNFGRTITIHKGNLLYVGCINTYRATKSYDNLEDCLDACRSMVNNMPDWLIRKIGN